jgi:hypothetical protein
MSGRRWMAWMAIDPMPPVAQTATRNGLLVMCILLDVTVVDAAPGLLSSLDIPMTLPRHAFD